MYFVEAKSILTEKNGFHGMNVYRGCSHGCVYCDSRSLMDLFRKICSEKGVIYSPDECFSYLNEFPEKDEQLSIFDM